MSLARLWSSLKQLHFSKPAGDRPLYKHLRDISVASVLEVNVGTGSRSVELVHWLQQQGDCEGLRYAAIDAFDMGGEDHLSLKEFHADLSKLNVRPLPVPHTGNLAVALQRVAHTIGAVDVLILDCPPEELDEAGVRAIMPRLVHPDTHVFGQDSTGEGLMVLSAAQWDESTSRSAAA